MTITLIPLTGMPEISAGDIVADAISTAASAQHTPIADDDCVVVTQKIVSKAEGRVVAIDPNDSDARRRLIDDESRRILRRRGPLTISETHHGFICANAGVDFSNLDPGTAALLPIDPDRSAHRIRERLVQNTGAACAVIVSDTFGRAWRRGLTDVAIGISGLHAILDLRGTVDDRGRTLEVTEIAIADEVAGAAELAMGKAAHIPVVIVRGLNPEWFAAGRGAELVRPSDEDFFR